MTGNELNKMNSIWEKKLSSCHGQTVIRADDGNDVAITNN